MRAEMSVAAQNEAIEGSWREFWEWYGAHSAGAVWERGADVSLLSFGLPHPLFNHLYDSDANLSSERIGALRDAMNARGLPWFWVSPPSQRRGDLETRFEACGMFEAVRMPGMILDLEIAALDAALPVGLEIRQATDSKGLQAFCDAILPAYEMSAEFAAFFLLAHEAGGYGSRFSGRYCYGVWQGESVAGSMVFFGKEVAILQAVGTRPEARGRGFGSAVVCACLRAAREAGYRYVVLHASDMGYPLYLRLGFEERFTQGFYMPIPS